MQPRDQLTTKEIQVTTLVWEGLTNREIAKIVGTTEQVIKTTCAPHLTNSVYGADSSWRCTWRAMAGPIGLTSAPQ